MNILITGATGSVGYDLVNYLSKNHKIYALYRKKTHKIKTKKNVIWIKIKSLSNFRFPKKLKIQSLVHCAVDQRYLSIDKNKYFRSNISITKNLLQFLKKQKKGIFFNFSTIEIYGIVKKNILNEKYKPFKQNIYGMMKFKCEKLIEKSGLNYVNLRLPGVLNTFSKEIKNRPWINLISNKLMNNEQFSIYNSRQKFNNVINTNEIAKIIIKLSKMNKVIKSNFNLSSSKPIKLKKLIKFMILNTNSKSLVIEKKSNKKSFLISNKKIENFLGCKIENTIKIIQEHLKNRKIPKYDYKSS
tara:strand:- start:1647 stop:2546 length:900 start_codon:yes stop_codon:yes gene_type:complete